MLTPVCSPALAAGAHPIRRPSDLAHHALLQLYTAEDEWSVWRRAAGLVEPVGDGGVRFDSYLLALEAAIDGQGVAIVPDFLAAPDLRTGRLVAPFDLAVPQPRQLVPRVPDSVGGRRERLPLPGMAPPGDRWSPTS